jgi:L-ascorbate metabolism protein UlaG (beta-lactamase superfamily)
MKRILLSIAILSTMLIAGCGGGDNNVKNCTAPPTVSAGEDQVVVDETTVTLNGTTSENKGTWSIIQGDGGVVHNGDPVTFTGELKTTYKLKFASNNDCGTSADEVSITLNVGCGDDKSLDDMVASLHWIQQSCFRIDATPFNIYIDPSTITEEDDADIILITHPHSDHYTAGDLDKLSNSKTIIIAPEGVTYTGTYAKRVVLKPGEELTAFGCVNIKAVNAYNINKDFHAKASNWVGYLITVNGKTIYHAGDTELIPEMKDFTCDIALLPLGQTYTFDKVEDAVQAAKDVQAKVAIPMHYGVYEGTADDAATFKNLLDGTIPVVIKVKGE